jgi:hypothetical protein
MRDSSAVRRDQPALRVSPANCADHQLVAEAIERYLDARDDISG